ncbi:fibronectin type III domain-containing protein [Paenibacillus periandrae]|uniref:fibronectin type III domain-containing protein n=1 Tax=Paenibacillus periandrae TaxID=1761741 RepID=UPI001F099CF7|nr:S-layer homology domain-containing protein [Paenibacillus periandrae]
MKLWIRDGIFKAYLSVLLVITLIFPQMDLKAVSAETVDKQLFYDGFEYGDNVTVPTDTTPWTQDGGTSVVKTAASGKRTGSYGAKIDSKDSLTLHLSTAGYKNIYVSYWYKASSVTAGGIKAEYSVDGGTNWLLLQSITANQSTFVQKSYTLIAPAYTSADNLADFRVRFRVDPSITLAGNIYLDDVEVRGTSMTEAPPLPDPDGPELEIYTENFDDPDNFGSSGGVVIPAPWVQEGANGSAAKTSSSSSAPSLPNMVKMDSSDALALPLDLTGYGNIKLSYYTRASSYTAGSIITEWSANGGVTWTTLEEYKLPAGTTSEPNTQKLWTLGKGANSNTSVKIRFRVGEAVSANMYIDSVSISGQAIPGIPPAASPVPVTPPPTDPTPYIPPAGVKMYEDVQIGTAGTRPLYASIAVPDTAPAAAMPVMVYIHGGGWNHGDRKQALSNISSYVAKRGYIGVSLDYRLTPEAPYPAQIQDVKLAIRYLRANAALYHLDPSRIGVWGSSAGGHLASLLGTTGDLLTTDQVLLDNGHTVPVPDLEGSGGWPEYSDKVQAVADWFGPADFTTEFANSYSSVTALLGGHKAFTVPDEARTAMPGTYATPDDPPFWIRHGDADATIPYTDSVKLAGQLRAAEVNVVDFSLVPGQGHGFTGDASDQANTEAWIFMDKYVKNKIVTEPIIYKTGNPPSGNPSITLNKTSLTLAPNESSELTAIITPADPSGSAFNWTSSDSHVAAVVSSGPAAATVTALNPGKAIIRAASTVSQQVYAESEITVTEPPVDPGNIVYLDKGSLAPTDDAVIDSSKATTNYDSATGSSAGLFSVSSGGTNKKYVYFKYDVSGYSSPDYKYTFNVAAKKGSSNTDVALSLYGTEDTGWTESTLTWSNAPLTNLASASYIDKFTVTADNTGSPQLYSVDVSAYVRSKLSMGGKVAFVLADAANTGISLNIYSKEANGTSNPRPKLVVQEPVDLSSDKEPPSWPSGSHLSAANLGTDFIHLSWPAATDNKAVTQYRIYKNDVLLTTVSGTAYHVTGLIPGAAYTFKVEAGDLSNNFTPSPLALSRTTLSAPITPIPVEGVVAGGSDGNIEINTIDNNLFTRWSASGDGQWILYDLGESKRVGYVGIAFYKGDLRATNLAIETSDDGRVWSERFAGSSSGKTTDMQAFDIQDQDARYVRIVGRGNSDGSAFTSITEVHIYAPFANGDTPVASIPYFVPGPPPGAVPFTVPGMKNADGTEHPIHTAHAVTGRTLNVLDYGANPADNAADDRQAIQAAINAAVAGDEVLLPNGTYNLNSSPDGLINLTLKTGVNLRGESQSGTILKTSLNKIKNSAMLKVSGQHDLMISNLTLTSTWDGSYSTDHKVNNPASGGPDSMLVIANYGDTPSYHVTMEHLIVEKFTRMGIRIDNSHDAVVRNSIFRNATDVGPGGSGYGVAIQGTAKVDRLGFDNDTRWNLVENSSFEGPYLRHGALIQFVAHNNLIRNNLFNRTKLDAIDLHGELEYLNEISGNTVTNILTGGAVGLGNTGGTAPSNHSKSGPKNFIHDNTIRNTREGVVVTMGTPDTIIHNNLIELTTNIDGAAGIRILNGPGTVITNNLIRGNTANGYWGILLEHDNGDQNAGYIGAGDPSHVQIIGNTLTGNSNGIQIKAGTGIEVRSNMVNSLNVNYVKSESAQVIEDWPSGNTDTSPPSWPNGAALSAANITQTGAVLSWSAAADNIGVSGYKLYKDNVLLATVTGTTYSYTVSGLNAGMTYNFSVRATDAAGLDSQPLSVSVTTQQGTPPIVPPAAGDSTPPSWPNGAALSTANITQTGAVLSWPAAADNIGVSGYKLYKDSVLLTTVTGTTYSYTVSGLSAGMTYSFSVKAIDAAGLDSQPLSVSVTTQQGTTPPPVVPSDTTPPSWPGGALLSLTNVSQRSLTLSWPAAVDNIGVTAYKIIQDGVSIETIKETSYNVTGLIPSKTYDYSIVPLDGAGNAGSALTVSARTIQNRSNTSTSSGSASAGSGSAAGGDNTSTSAQVDGTPGPTGAEVEGSTITLIPEKSAEGAALDYFIVNTAGLSKALESIKDKEAFEQIITIQVKGIGTAVTVELPSAAIHEAMQHVPDAMISIQSGPVTYNLPIKVIDIAAAAKALGSDVKDVQIQLTIEKVAGPMADEVQRGALHAGLTLHGGDKPQIIRFDLTASAGGKTITIHNFGTTYVTRSIKLDHSIDSSKVTAVLYDPVNQEMTFVPAVFSSDNGSGGTQITIKNHSNSIYTIVESNKTFVDASNHWAKADIELLAAKLLVKGETDTTFGPDHPITRAQFAALLVGALGLGYEARTDFVDMNGREWFAGAVGAAAQAGLVTGFEDSTFKPDTGITREQMALMLVRAMAIAGKTYNEQGNRTELLLSKFDDKGEISSWAQLAVAQAVGASILNGQSDNKFGSFANATRAEAVVMLKRFLQFEGFIN